MTGGDDRVVASANGFDDLLAANAAFAARFALGGFDGVAHRGVAIVTCMDSRIDPLGMLGLVAGDAKIMRDLGGRVTDEVLAGLVLATNLLGVVRVLLIAHTRCAAASNTETELRERVGRTTGTDASWMSFHSVADQAAALREDVHRVTSHPLVPEAVLVGGFMYDVDTGLLHQVV